MVRSVRISEDAYAVLTALKREDESFSDVVTRLVSQRYDPRALKELPGLREDFDLEALRARSGEIDRQSLDHSS